VTENRPKSIVVVAADEEEEEEMSLIAEAAETSISRTSGHDTAGLLHLDLL